jgi:hypothetical protein
LHLAPWRLGFSKTFKTAPLFHSLVTQTRLKRL